MQKNIIIYGKGNFAKQMLYYFNTSSDYKTVAFCADNKYITNDSFCDLPIISFDEVEFKYPPNMFKAFVAAGYSNMRARKMMFESIKAKGYTCVNYISPLAIIDSSIQMGENNVILQNCVIEPYVRIRHNNIIWSSCNICHNVDIYNDSFIASQSLIGGFSIIKDNCFIGFNSTIIQNITLEDETLIGAKALVLNNTERYSKYLGAPAKRVSTHKELGIKIL
ncbi:sugar O-acyltransferase, sialic acid O-acetyltransferase NeuD family protein [Francisella philomiragia]|uniref:NeuD/PglB/VioB family sugar acetyltransferase n=1 Tax=Francisella philomiragia TaxID=28110 RepID=UPI0005A57B4E|nr:NeuD/PglB/VioB family sugar acetyltransferase [Francisella philomiragia]AJI54759.1 sugar O-acyltransferase, sialic acid O-acetyltransferase NeuD family protein [Francisella philomiragia]MBK2253662.1 NeuD/PglB/VioB family sugar acetyltransferase [Francisella philomiragia]